jgi:two-component system, LytTR family, response regulator LytT
MKVVIIEDEKLTASDLAETILMVEPAVQIVAVLNSVKEALAYFKKSNLVPDLLFSDIQLGDGLSFEIFNKIDCSFPVIFCTAYDEYALNAFKTNGIDYILKPFSEKTIFDAFEKYKTLKNSFSRPELNYDTIWELFKKPATKSGSVLVYHKDKIIPVKFDEIALFYIETEITFLITFDNTKYVVNKTLEELERLVSDQFYRANRQFLINRNAIKDASPYFSRKLSVSLTVPFGEKIFISKEKSGDFLDWLSNG